MSKPQQYQRPGAPLSWELMARPDSDQRRRFLAESLSLLLADILRSVLADASPAVAADAAVVERYQELTDSDGDAQPPERQGALVITRAVLAKRCVTWLKVLLTAPPDEPGSAALREFVDALALFPALFDNEPSARSRRARLTWLLTHDRRLDASTREAAAALIEACEHLGVLLWPDAETA